MSLGLTLSTNGDNQDQAEPKIYILPITSTKNNPIWIFYERILILI